ncbi:unnamed protein product [Prunus brigantina]
MVFLILTQSCFILIQGMRINPVYIICLCTSNTFEHSSSLRPVDTLMAHTAGCYCIAIDPLGRCATKMYYLFIDPVTKKECLLATIVLPESVIHSLSRVGHRTTSDYIDKALALIWIKGMYLQDGCSDYAIVPNNVRKRQESLP